MQLNQKLDELERKFEDLTKQMADPEVINSPELYRRTTKSHSELDEVVQDYRAYKNAAAALSGAEGMLQESDPELRAMGEEEREELAAKREDLLTELQKSLIPPDPYDDANIFLEVRAGTGGDEAAIFAGDLFRMYTRYAEQRGWQVEILSEREGEHGGYREIISRVSGNGIYAQLKFESGAHRVQRVPATESQGRIHTSACTVAVLPEPDEIEAEEINPADLRVDTYRASGAGGQHVNKTDSAVRLTHLPSGIVVECQDERSQHKNRARALSLLQARLLDAKVRAQQTEQAQKRKLLVGSGDRSERIRTYNFPQGRVTDHRINLTLYKLDEILAGNLEPVIQPLINEYEADQLAALSN